MNYWRCVCGKREAWESGFPPAPCDVCEDCGSTLAVAPHLHKEPEPHEIVVKYDQNTGEAYQFCVRCYKNLGPLLCDTVG